MMQRTTFGKAAISSLIVATTMVGCSGAAFHPRAAVSQPKGDPAKLAAKAAEALDDRDADDAVRSAEAAVQLAPQNAGYRQLLGRAYVLAGRFASAETALSDALALGSSDARTIVSLALVQVAQRSFAGLDWRGEVALGPTAVSVVPRRSREVCGRLDLRTGLDGG